MVDMRLYLKNGEQTSVGDLAVSVSRAVTHSRRVEKRFLCCQPPSALGCRDGAHLVDHAFLHHEAHVLHDADVLQRIARHGDQVGKLAGATLPRSLSCSGAGGMRRRRLQHEHGRHPRLHHQFELVRVLAMRIHPGIGAEGDLDSRPCRPCRRWPGSAVRPAAPWPRPAAGSSRASSPFAAT